MAEYHYKYNRPQGPGGQNPGGRGPGGQNPGGDDLLSWVVIGLALLVFWPVGLFLLFRKLMDSSYRSQRTASGGTSAAAPAAQPRAQARAKAPDAPAQRRQKLDGGGFLVGGGILTGVFGFSLLTSLAEAVASHALRGAFSGLVSLAGLTGVGLVLLYVGLFRRRRSKRFRQYLALIGQRESVSVAALAQAAGRDPKKVREDLQDMLDLGALPVGYLDLARDRLVLTAQGIDDQPEAAEPQPRERDDNDTLAEIRAVNDAIPDPVMSAKIDRIGELTGRILDYQRQNPDKAGQLRSFLNYYLPTTLKILRAYAQLDQQGVEGENISAAKARIEGMMDKVVEGFETQLDKLFRDEALDIASDVSVLERMLDKDGLGRGGMTL